MDHPSIGTTHDGSYSHVTGQAHGPKRMRLNARKPCEIQGLYQRTTNRKPPTACLMVTWPRHHVTPNSVVFPKCLRL